MKVCVIGSGISGLSVANMLHRDYAVTVYEKTESPGGLIKCTLEDGNLFHRVGGHVFNSKNQQVLEWFWGFFDKESEFIQAKRNAKIYMQGEYFGYPLENFIHKLSPEIISQIINDLLTNQGERVCTNFAEFLEFNFGSTLYHLYFRPYNEKIWRTDLREIPLDWLEGKLPMPNTKEIIVNNILRKGESEMVHSTFYYPKKNGSQFIVDRLAEGLIIETNRDIATIRKEERGWLVDEKDSFDYIIYTGDIRNLINLIKIDSENLNRNLINTASLISNGTSNVLCYTDDIDLSWLYFPEVNFLAHRIIYTGNFSSSNNALSKKTCVVEFSGKVEPEKMIKEIAKMPGLLKPIAFNYEPNSYIINTFETRSLIQSIKSELEGSGFYLLGRFAEWQYYNMDKCIERAFDVVSKIDSNLSIASKGFQN